jgi:hypothetical protein
MSAGAGAHERFLSLMSVQKHPQAATATDPLSGALDRLYGAPLAQFVALRRELSNALRAAGELPASRLVATAGKPTRTSWALNQVARRHPELLHALFEARDAAAPAQTQGDADQVRAAARGYRERVVSVVQAARDALREVGVGMNAAQSRRVGESLQAAAAGGDDARARLLAGRLAQDVDVEDPFAGLEFDAGRVGPPRAPQRADQDGSRAREAREQAARERKIEEERAQQRQAIESARQRVAALEEKAREARGLARDAEVAARRAQSSADRARQAAVEAESRLERARADLQALRKE